MKERYEKKDKNGYELRLKDAGGSNAPLIAIISIVLTLFISMVIITAYVISNAVESNSYQARYNNAYYENQLKLAQINMDKQIVAAYSPLYTPPNK